jgi:hypothetical protein
MTRRLVLPAPPESLRVLGHRSVLARIEQSAEPAKPSGKDLQTLKELIEAGEVTPVIDRTHTLTEVPDAIRYWLSASQWGARVRIRGGDGRAGQVIPPV